MSDVEFTSQVGVGVEFIPAPEVEAEPYHAVRLHDLLEALSALRSEDVIVPNAVSNLAVLRGGEYIAYVDLGPQGPALHWVEEPR